MKSHCSLKLNNACFAVQNNKYLRELDLSHNRFTEIGADIIGPALGQCCTLLYTTFWFGFVFLLYLSFLTTTLRELDSFVSLKIQD